MKVIDEAAKLIDSLGTVSNLIAERLKTLRVRGVKASFSSCPLARYVQDKLGNRSIFIGSSCIHFDESTRSLSTEQCKFLREFDIGQYPDLEEPY